MTISTYRYLQLAAVFAVFTSIGCNKDFLNKSPLDTLSTDHPLASTNELRLYVDQFYASSLPAQPTGVNGPGIAFNDGFGTDNMGFGNTPDARMSGALSPNGAVISGYTTIRSVNYFLEHYTNAQGDQALINNYLGEAKFFRAITYFNMVKNYGDLTWVNKVLPADASKMEVPRDPRTLVIDSVLADLDQAAALLPVQSTSSTMRIHRDVALALKSRIALYEATWQKYHKAKNDAFFTPGITDEKIRDYFQQAKAAANAVITSGRWKIYNTGKPLSDYQNLFITADLSANSEVMLWRRYNVSDLIGNSVAKYVSTGGANMGISLSLVDDYLTINGTPFTGIARANAQAVYGTELLPSIRDPRLSQTVVVPKVQQMKPGTIAPAYPALNGTSFNMNTTGYPLAKFLSYNDAVAYTDDFKDQTPAIAFRYAEVLLNYAEAAAELGDDAGAIAAVLKPLRDRAGMPVMNAATEFNSDPNYPFHDLSPLLQAVRRERRVELACEGYRLDDIMRWAAADVLVKGKRPLGALFTGSDLVQQNTAAGFYGSSLLIYDTPPAGKKVNLYLSGNPGDALRYIDPYKAAAPNGFGFNLSRDYLLPIQQRQLQLTGFKWVQNPGW
ncbi:RagB/SusD family nutrient uptake outer membrane protein [Chitinophaga sp. Cy-1792]|uniref:RagB/SusD family nutrient uptake outer membrane protein n=1 Tax=Chitinophaga sp. Cy-1792 TaxID=2608339 RepID=UPI001422E8A9|nr:RagB/SusD family nutrient uptake outer membrane protein [Chitinophaga sp. Cy-1792]NIG55649.1 RagB/SusD family nutrient uptake outer membrane protein [Chitinophaga sp. Cy-1792]